MLKTKNHLALTFMAVLLIMPLFQMVSATIMNTKPPDVNSGGYFHERDELRTARNIKWLEWWVTVTLRLFGIEPR